MAAQLAYQRYWDDGDPEYLQVLRDEIAAVIDDYAGNPIASAHVIVAQLFKRVRLHTWCELDGCAMGSRPDCRQTHYAFDIRSHPHEFAYPADHDR